MIQIDWFIVHDPFTKLGTNCAIDHGPLRKIATICNFWTNIDKRWTNLLDQLWFQKLLDLATLMRGLPL